MNKGLGLRVRGLGFRFQILRFGKLNYVNILGMKLICAYIYIYIHIYPFIYICIYIYRFIFSGSRDEVSPRVQIKSRIPGFLRGISLTRGARV